MDTLDLLRDVISAMEEAETILELDGESKKNAVLTLLKKNLIHYDKYEEIIKVMIEAVIVLSKTKLLINLKKTICCMS
jgi:hypothetical protein